MPSDSTFSCLKICSVLTCSIMRMVIDHRIQMGGQYFCISGTISCAPESTVLVSLLRIAPAINPSKESQIKLGQSFSLHVSARCDTCKELSDKQIICKMSTHGVLSCGHLQIWGDRFVSPHPQRSLICLKGKPGK